jgi:hypothetical protein
MIPFVLRHITHIPLALKQGGEQSFPKPIFSTMVLPTLIPAVKIVPALLLRSSDSGGFVAYCVVGICAGIYLFVRGFRLIQRRRLILDTPVSKIRSAALGMVELSGLAVGPYTVSAPITGRTCYFFRTLAWEWKREGRSTKWVKVACESMHVPFFVDDNTGKLMVDPRGAELDLHCDFKEQFCDSLFTLTPEAPANVRDFLSRHGISTTNKIKVEEFCIKPKNALFLLGTLDENPGMELTQQPILDEEETTMLGRARLSLAAGVGGDLFSGLSLTGGLQHNPAFDPIYERAISTASARVIKACAFFVARHVRGHDAAAENCFRSDEGWNFPSLSMGHGWSQHFDGHSSSECRCFFTWRRAGRQLASPATGLTAR